MQSNPPPRILTPQESLKILVVEDNSDDSDLLANILTSSSNPRWEVYVARSLSDAQDFSSAMTFDVITLDLGLPDSIGFDTLTSISALFPTTPVVVLTGDNDDQLGRSTLGAGAQDFLCKSDLNSEILARTLRYAIERSTWVTQFRTIVDDNSDAIVVLDRNEIIQLVNPAAETLFEKTSLDLVGERFGFPIRAKSTSEISITTRGAPRFAEMRVAEINWNGVAGYVATLRDITDRKKAEEYERRLRHSDRLASIGQLAAGVAHEINNPATFVTANLDILRSHLRRLCDASTKQSPSERSAKDMHLWEEAIEMVEECNVGIKRINSIVRDLRTFSRIDRNDAQLEDINDIVEVACGMTQNEIRHRARLTKDLAELPKIVVDREKIAQALVNLLVNAAQAISEGDALQHSISVTTRHLNNQIQIEVTDTGPGIPAEDQQRIFEPFYTTKPREIGTGLGLSLCAETIRKHGGSIEVNSVVGEGTTFQISLPMNTTMKIAKPKQKSPTPVPILTRAKILLIDDEPMVRKAISRILRNHNVVEAANGRIGLDILTSDPTYDIVLCDLMMPDLDGPCVYETLESQGSSMVDRFIFVSGGAFTARAKKFLRDVQPVVIEKPLSGEALREVIYEFLQCAGDPTTSQANLSRKLSRSGNDREQHRA